MPGARVSLRAGGWFHVPASAAGGRGLSGGRRPADADLGVGGAGGQARPAGRETRASLGFPVPVPVAVDGDAAAGEGGQGAVSGRGGQGGGQARGGRAGADGGDDRAAGGGERDLPGVHRLSGAASPAGRDG